MIALDTNVVVRLVTADDRAQTARAREVMGSGGSLWLAKSVLLETEWVLRGAYGLPPATIAGAFRRLLGYPPLAVEDRIAVLRAIEWLEEGLDFADALHLASSADADRLVTFDRRFARAAGALEVRPVVEALSV